MTLQLSILEAIQNDYFAVICKYMYLTPIQGIKLGLQSATKITPILLFPASSTMVPLSSSNKPYNYPCVLMG